MGTGQSREQQGPSQRNVISVRQAAYPPTGLYEMMVPADELQCSAHLVRDVGALQLATDRFGTWRRSDRREQVSSGSCQPGHRIRLGTYVERSQAPGREAPLMRIRYPKVWVCFGEIDGHLAHEVSGIDQAEYAILPVEGTQLRPGHYNARLRADGVQQTQADGFTWLQAGQGFFNDGSCTR